MIRRHVVVPAPARRPFDDQPSQRVDSLVVLLSRHRHCLNLFDHVVPPTALGAGIVTHVAHHQWPTQHRTALADHSSGLFVPIQTFRGCHTSAGQQSARGPFRRRLTWNNRLGVRPVRALPGRRTGYYDARVTRNAEIRKSEPEKIKPSRMREQAGRRRTTAMTRTPATTSRGTSEQDVKR